MLVAIDGVGAASPVVYLAGAYEGGDPLGRNSRLRAVRNGKVDAPVQVLLLDVRQDARQGGPRRSLHHGGAAIGVEAVWRQAVVRVHVAMHRQSDLFEVVLTLEP